MTIPYLSLTKLSFLPPPTALLTAKKQTKSKATRSQQLYPDWNQLHQLFVSDIQAALPLVPIQESQESQDKPKTETRKRNRQQVPQAASTPTLSSSYSNTLITSEKEQVCLIDQTAYLFPRHCRFVWSELDQSTTLLTSSLPHKYHIIVMDPPWPSKSVQRSKQYPSLSLSTLLQLPIPTVVQDSPTLPAFVVVWVTNNPTIYRFVVEEVFPAWNLTLVCHLVWVKLAQNGELIYPLNHYHKRPYEVALVGCTNPTLFYAAAPWASSAKVRNEILFGYPTWHSRKPYFTPFFTKLEEIIQSISQKAEESGKSRNPISKLELFARNLRPGWASWGNEVLKFQRLSFFKMKSNLIDSSSQKPNPTQKN